jgi:cell filamentation protein
VSADDPYLIPGTSVLRNNLGIPGAATLDSTERELVTQRITEGIPGGRFDLIHLQAIHRHLFQDIYTWAGEVRTVEIAKGGQQFLFRQFIETGMGDIHRRLVARNFLRGLTSAAFAEAAGTVMGDVNYVHPFREGNGRTQLLYLDLLAEQAYHRLDLSLLDPVQWIAASRAAHDGDYGPMSAAIRLIEV